MHCEFYFLKAVVSGIGGTLNIPREALDTLNAHAV